jgi:RNA polymerase sigma factor (TIGR02999 family)
MGSDKGEVTLLLHRLSEGDRSAEEALVPRVYVELHRLALRRLGAERPGHTLQATALVNEAYMRLFQNCRIDWQDRIHFFCVAATVMRSILVTYARQHDAEKRKLDPFPFPLDEAISISGDQSLTALIVDELLCKLAEFSPRQAQIVEMRFFAGLSEAEIASVLKKSVRTIRRDWLMARAWLHQQLTQH